MLAEVLRAGTSEEAAVTVGVLTGEPRQGRIGVGWATLSQLDADPAADATLEVLEVDRWFDELTR